MGSPSECSKARSTRPELCLSAGAMLVIFSDGLTDALNARGEEFGDERVVQCCLGIAPRPAKDIAEIKTRAQRNGGRGRAV